jgi:hypothetical protein
MQSVEQVAGAMGEADADAAAEPQPPVATEAPLAMAADPPVHPPVSEPLPTDPWAAILDAGASLLQALAAARASGAAAPLAIERDPVTGQASVRLPLPDEAVLHKLAKAFEPWLR